LKKTRLIISFSFLILYILLFTGFINGLSWLTGILSGIQIMPAVLKVIGVSAAGAIGLGAILSATILAGRFYCSAICPLGTVQDIFISAGRKIFKKAGNRNSFHKAANIFRYTLLAAASALFISGNLILINLLEPFSNFGRAAANLLRPPAAYFFNSISIFADIPLHRLEIPVVILTFSFFLALFLISVFRGRLYCNLFCPTGAILSVLSRFSIWKLSISGDKCTGCGLCEKVCKAECIDSAGGSIDYSRCIHCYDCLDACSFHAVEFKPAFIKRKGITMVLPDENRRHFLSMIARGSLALLVLPFLGMTRAAASIPFLPAGRKHPVIPPGAISIDHFTAFCTGCHLCVAACPSHVIKPMLSQYGVRSIYQPVMDYDSSFCNYECAACLKVCPSGAIKEFALEEKKLIQIGIANLNKNSCIVYSQGKQCGICAEYCPTKAVYLVPYKKDLPAPETDESVCIGCGACENACPARPEKAIFVEGNPVHLKAKIKENKPVRVKKPASSDFPF
jgi:ferredoxin